MRVPSLLGTLPLVLLGTLVLMALMTGCGPSETVLSPGSDVDGLTATDVLPSHRIVTGPQVLKADGTPYDHPFLGGLNVPRPQLVDVDGDGDADLFLQEYTGSVMFFENVGDERYEFRSAEYQGLDVGEWYRFVDLDSDGDFDLLAEQPYSYIRYYRNEGTPQEPRFVPAVDTLRDVNGEAIYSDRQNIPNATDIDCDGRTDLFLGRLDGTITRYEAVDDSDEPVFRVVTDRFEDIEIVAQFGQPGNTTPAMPNIPNGSGLPGNGPSPEAMIPDFPLRAARSAAEAASPSSVARHGANTMTFADIDGDGDMDLFWGDFFEPSLLFIENTGSCESPSLRGEPEPYPPPDPIVSSGYNAPAFGDVDLDGDADLLVGVLGGAFNPNLTTHSNLYYYEQLEDGRFTLRTRRFLDQIDVGSESYPRLADLDGDGDVDLFLANKISSEDSQTSVLLRYEHTADGLRMRDSLRLIPSYHYAPEFADLDGDGDLDMLLGTWNDGVALYHNKGTPTEPRLELVEESYIELTRGSHTTPDLVDIDNDGDLDLFIGETSGTINFYENTGTASEARFELVSDEFEGIDVGRRSVPRFIDVDADGDQDMIVGSETEGLVLFKNTGSPEAPVFQRHGPLAIDVPPLAVPEFGDVDGDGRDELLVGGLGGGLYLFDDR